MWEVDALGWPSFPRLHDARKGCKVMAGTKISTLEEARAAKAKAAQLLRALPLVGIGITRIGEGYGVKVNLSRSICTDQLPTEVDGVPIQAEVVGEIRKR
jgi:hypothetical protein